MCALLNIFEKVPFEIKRIFTIRGIRAHEKRGHHAHKDTSLILIALSGSCKVTLDDGEHEPETVHCLSK